MVVNPEDVGRFYRILIVDYAGFYREPKPKDYVYWKKVTKLCEENDYDYRLLMIAHFEYHKKHYNSHPYPNMLYGSSSPQRYESYVESLLARYPNGDLPLRALFETFSIIHQVENDCYRIKLIAQSCGLSRFDAAISIFYELSPYIKLLEPKLTSVLRQLKGSKTADCRQAQKLLYKNRGLKGMILEVLRREFHARSLSIRP